MTNREHVYCSTVAWTGNLGTGTSDYRGYSRANEIHHTDKVTIPGSSDASFRGDPSRWNPEDLLVASLAQCHMLAFLHVAADHGVCVTSYTDTPIGTMLETPDGGGYFESVILRPAVTISDGDPTQLGMLHERAHQACFIASSVNFPVTHEATATVSGTPSPIPLTPGAHGR